MPNAETGTTVAVGGATFDNNRTFGLELEAYNCESSRLAAAITRAGVDCVVEGYNHETRSHWKIVSDASIRGVNAFELVSPPLKGTRGLDEVAVVCRVLKEKGVKVNRSTGLHVHHDASDLRLEHVKSVLTFWWKFEDVLLYFLPVSRRANVYCAPAIPRVSPDGQTYKGYAWNDAGDPVEGWKAALDRVTDMGQFERASGRNGAFQPSRYAPVNTHAISKHGTLEFRSHSGTTEFDKIQAWVVLTQWMITKAKTTGCSVRTRMTGRWAAEARHFWKSIGWINLDDAQVIKAKNTLNRRFKFFKQLEAEGQSGPTSPLAEVNASGRLRPTRAAEQEEPGER